MAHWYATCHGNAVNLDHARQVFVKEGHDGLFRVCAEFVVSSEKGETVSYSLESGYETEGEADTAMRLILGAPGGGEEPPPVELRQRPSTRTRA